MSDRMGNIEHWEYQSWTIYGVCQGCGAANASMHALNCSRPGREDVKVVPASQLRGAVDALKKIAESDSIHGVTAANALSALGIGDPLLDRLGGQ
jgi:predicted xylose isomerase-like sugar epimerase